MRFEAVWLDGSGVIANEDVRADIRDEFRKLKGKHIDITIEVHSKQRKRTSEQNAFLHAEPFPKLAAKWGESVARAKLICMGEFWGWEPCAVSGALLPVKAHTSDMTVTECTTFIDWLIPWAAVEHGVEITSPQEVR
jgi:hypothetical protein